MPTPNKNETHDKYIERCMSYPEMNSKHPDGKQRFAICESMWKAHKTKGWINQVLKKEDNENN